MHRRVRSPRRDPMAAQGDKPPCRPALVVADWGSSRAAHDAARSDIRSTTRLADAPVPAAHSSSTTEANAAGTARASVTSRSRSGVPRRRAAHRLQQPTGHVRSGRSGTCARPSWRAGSFAGPGECAEGTTRCRKGVPAVLDRRSIAASPCLAWVSVPQTSQLTANASQKSPQIVLRSVCAEQRRDLCDLGPPCLWYFLSGVRKAPVPHVLEMNTSPVAVTSQTVGPF